MTNAKKDSYSISESLFGLIDTLGQPSCIYRQVDDIYDYYYLCYEYDEITIIADVGKISTDDPRDKNKEIEVWGVKQTMIYGKGYWEAEQDWFAEYMDKQ